MTHVTDEQLGKIARQQADLFQRVREGSLDAEKTSRKLQDITAPTRIIYYFRVDYERSLDDAVKLGHYDLVDNKMNSRNFSSTRRGKTEIEGVPRCLHEDIKYFGEMKKVSRWEIYATAVRKYGETPEAIQRYIVEGCPGLT